MIFKLMYILCIILILNTVNGDQDVLQQIYNKNLFSNVDISNVEKPYELLHRFLTPEHVFQQLFNKGGVNINPMQECSMHSLDSESNCTQSFCEIFLELYQSFVEKTPPSIPHWAVKSKYYIYAGVTNELRSSNI